jgi:GMP synthase (glutamine-hydrolysing)
MADPQRSPRVRASGDIEVSGYLELARQKSGEAPAGHQPDIPAQPEAVVVIDFGSQYSMLIARRIRELHVYCELVPHDAPWEKVEKLRPRGVILSGGPNSVYDLGAPMIPDWVFEQKLPVLGICYGMQLLAHQLGGRVSPSDHREYGHAVVHQGEGETPLFDGLPASMPVWMSHGDRITQMPPGFRSLAYSDNSPIAAMGDGAGKIAIQFHPEVVHTPHGKQLIENFLYKMCGCRGDWTAGNFIADGINRIRKQIGDGRVICALSGGVDSAVAATLVHRAVGDQLTCIFVDNGLMRRQEPERVVDTFQRHMEMQLVHVDAADRFLTQLKGITDPEQKRRIVGETFIRVFEAEADKIGKVDFITQGTTYPDVVESATTGGATVKIKTHHNVGGLPKELTFELVEPLRYLF